MLSTVGEDSTAWQLRAKRLIGSEASFPVGPRENFDWPTACLEIEKLITCWTGEAPHKARQTQENEESDRVNLQGRAPVAERQEDAGGEELQGEEVAHGADEGVEVVLEAEDGEMQPVLDGDQLARLRIELEERLVGEAVELEDGGIDLNGDQDAALHHHMNQEDDGDLVEVINHRASRSPGPPPALECITLPSSHIGQINSVLLLGGEGGVCATASRDWNVKLWDLQSGSNGTLVHTLGRQGDFSSHRGWVWCLASEGPLLASGGFDSTVRLWDLEAGGADRGLFRTKDAVLCLSCQTDVLLAGTYGKKINMYDTRGERV